MPEAISTRTLLEAAWPQATHGLGLIGAVTAGVVLLTLSAKVQVPFWPVPMTLQTLAVLLLGMAYGPGLGLATVMVYLLLGAVGLPVFAGTPERGIGLVYMAGPTAGFLAGFALAAVMAGCLARWGWDKSILQCAVAMLAGHVLIVLAGVAWLAVRMGPGRAIEVGLVPFLLPALAKSAIGAVCMPLLWRALGAR
jgi:biotin transport system substrate-specific component